MNYLLDTCVISELTKKRPDKSLVQWISSISEFDCYISVITFGEIQKGISRLEKSSKKKELEKWLQRDLLKRFSGRILDITAEITLQWGEILGENEKKGTKPPVIDALIAATAIINNQTVVSRNVKDIIKCGAKAINPWET